MIIELGIAASIGAIVGFGTRAVLTAGKVAGLDKDIQDCCEDYAHVATENHKLRDKCKSLEGQAWARAAECSEASSAHTRVTDALAAKKARITTLTDIARNQKSVKSGRIIDVLEG